MTTMIDAAAEIWLPIPGAVGYEMSPAGDVRSMPRVLIRSNGAPYTIRRPRVLKPSTDRDGSVYFRLGVGERGRVRWFYVSQRTIDKIFQAAA